ncbi:universal stress protein [Caulobacter sp. 1776]|uniref:universal stress protein n=1 Tax=Caulobacter sp. 1776 TaxID=3156420 RepID=UPI003393A419
MKTVLLLVHQDEGQEARLQAALDLVRALDGHLKCLDVTPVMVVAGDDGGVAQAMVQAEAQKLEAANRIALTARLTHEDIAWDWSDTRGDVAGCLLAAAGLADLLVINCKRDSFLRVEPHAVANAVVLAARCPVVAVPDEARGFDVGGHALVAWDGSEPAMAAVRAAAPLLRRAGSVALFTVEDKAKGASAEAAAAYLSRHGVHAVIEQVSARGQRPDAVILQACADQHASYCVMGAYGHGRLREDLFGGVTRGMLDAARLPLVLAH